MKKNTIIELLSFLLILLFVYVASSKLINFRHFQSQLVSYPYIKWSYKLISFGVPSIEILVSALLLFPRTRIFGFYSSLILLIGFTIYLIAMIMSGSHLPCSCGGVIEKLTWRQHIYFNLFFIAIALGGIMLERKKYTKTETIYA